jgi:diguanylate cyclase (GGDEF)-like protein
MAVILWDIDGFVDFNNRFGQEQGDRFLKKVSEVIHRCLRSYDEAFRAGGDEFCAILIPADDAVANEVTARVSQAVAKDLFQGNAEYADRQFSISSGLVFYPGENQVPEALLHAAGQALYRNKMARA